MHDDSKYPRCKRGNYVACLGQFREVSSKALVFLHASEVKNPPQTQKNSSQSFLLFVTMGGVLSSQFGGTYTITGTHEMMSFALASSRRRFWELQVALSLDFLAKRLIQPWIQRS